MKILFVLYDNESRDNILPIGITYVAAYLREHGYRETTYYCQDVYHYNEDHLHEYLKRNHFDVVAMGFVAGYFQHIKIKKICDAITSLKKKPFIVLGGHGPSPVPEYFIRYCGADAVVMGEGEIPFLNIIKALDNNENLSNVNGIAFRDGDRVIVNPREKPIMDLDSIPSPYLDSLPMEFYIKSTYFTSPLDRGISVSAQRGCVYHCNFCYRLEKDIRLRSSDNIVEEVKKYKRDYNINYVWFFDELFMLNEKRIFDICGKFLKNNLNINYFCTGRLNKANAKVLDIMKRSGCVAIDYGIEQFDDDALRKMNKELTTIDIENGIRLTLERGIRPLFNIIFGNIGDNQKTLKRSLDFLHKYNDYGQLRTIRPVTPYPGSPLYDLAIKKGLLKGPEDFYRKHKNLELLTVNFTEIPDDEFTDLMFEANKKIITSYYDYMEDKCIEDFRRVYYENDYSFRGTRH
ncbi:MAG: radical SAM protein [Candidatus Omnitrophica bacterium]|nr:radical SAM protein [Candidatus Omnitrophota bacterium]MDD5591889.1 radical SAM protein [Candidatus Omnitrophota bacterium]